MRRTIVDTDLNDYLYFAEAVAHGGFAAASRALGVPKSKLSRRIAGLEARLGVRLIERSTRKFRVTELGCDFYQRCRTIRELAEDAEAVLAATRTDPHGELCLSCPTGLLEIVVPTLPQFLIQFPKVRLKMLATDRQVDLIEEGVDVAIRVRANLDDSAALTMRKLGISRKILVADRQLAATLDSDIAKLEGACTLATSEEPSESEWTLIGKHGAVVKIRHEPRMRCSDFSAVREAATRGLGIALLPDHSCRDYLEQGKLVRVYPEWRGPDGFVHLVFTTRRGLPIASRALIDHLVSAFRPELLSPSIESDVPRARRTQ
ncbi:LysR family transcriptional regulator [Terricaulis silvestris]|uniref:D-malate degradation protein R n=1 Tax=Terricaulis silvestris TaxID=2686094 RepID=A0A6I6ML95_9CAUL|nr:LysR family transcriptional regulator [Terricaulis silvestris]QGZ93734.1 D-malate degradation protein R [Terricaulis silvestris]